MSASLVGSEMCIRDSGRSLPPAARNGTRAPRRRPPQIGPTSPGPRGYPPVSYTHLTLPTICSV
eukprot:12080253-Alexandrium_andersonii.AAC.1